MVLFVVHPRRTSFLVSDSLKIEHTQLAPKLNSEQNREGRPTARLALASLPKPQTASKQAAQPVDETVAPRWSRPRGAAPLAARSSEPSCQQNPAPRRPTAPGPRLRRCRQGPGQPGRQHTDHRSQNVAPTRSCFAYTPSSQRSSELTAKRSSRAALGGQAGPPSARPATPLRRLTRGRDPPEQTIPLRRSSPLAAQGSSTLFHPCGIPLTQATHVIPT